MQARESTQRGIPETNGSVQQGVQRQRDDRNSDDQVRCACRQNFQLIAYRCENQRELTDLREKGQISYFELRGSRELVLYWRELAPEQKTVLSIDLVCDVPGEYRGPASRGYLYYNADNKRWVAPLSVTIAALAE